jgi:hypothetical protein
LFWRVGPSNWFGSCRLVHLVDGIFMIHSDEWIWVQELDKSCLDFHLLLVVSGLTNWLNLLKLLFFISSVGLSSSLVIYVVDCWIDFLLFLAWCMFFLLVLSISGSQSRWTSGVLPRIKSNQTTISIISSQVCYRSCKQIEIKSKTKKNIHRLRLVRWVN